MEREEIRIEAPVTVAGVNLIPIVKVSLNYWHRKGSFSLFGNKQPVNIIVISPLGTRAFRINGEEVSLDQLMEEVPGIKETLAGIKFPASVSLPHLTVSQK